MARGKHTKIVSSHKGGGRKKGHKKGGRKRSRK